MIERAHRLVRGRGNRGLDPRRLGMDRDRIVAGGPRLQADPLVAVAALGAVHILDMDLDMGQPRLEPLQLRADPLLEPGIGVGVALDLVVGVIWTNTNFLQRLQLMNARGAKLFPRHPRAGAAQCAKVVAIPGAMARRIGILSAGFNRF